MAKLGMFKVDPVLETEGVWVKCNEGLELLIAGAENPNYRVYRSKLIQPHVGRMRAKKLTADELEDITKRAMARCILLGWKNLEDDDGAPIPYSEKKALEILRESRELYLLVADYAADQDQYRKKLNEESEKNS